MCVSKETLLVLFILKHVRPRPISESTLLSKNRKFYMKGPLSRHLSGLTRSIDYVIPLVYEVRIIIPVDSTTVLV